MICDAFDREWSAGARPRIEEHLGDIAEPDRSKLLRELLAIELEHRRKAPSLHEYAVRFPDHMAVVKDAFQIQDIYKKSKSSAKP